MRRRLWWRTGLFAAGMAVFFVAGVYASDAVKKVEAYLRGDFTIKLNGEPVHFSGPPLIYENRTYLPLAEIGQALHADVVWEGETKTIYVNTRIYDTQPKPADSTAGEMVFTYLHAEKSTYLGREYEILINEDRNGIRYYREKDLQRMGIDTNGLSKWQEPWTKALYIRESEAGQVWKMKPVRGYLPSHTAIAISDEDPAIVKLLRDYRLTVLLDPGAISDPNDMYLYSQLELQGVFIYVFDAVPNEPNQYEGLFQFRGQYYKLVLTLKPVQPSNHTGHETAQQEWQITGSRTELLGPLESHPTNPFNPGYIP